MGDKFTAEAPKLVADIFAEANIEGMAFSDLMGVINSVFPEICKRVGFTFFHNTKMFENPLEFFYRYNKPYGSLVEMIDIGVNGWADSKVEAGNTITKFDQAYNPAVLDVKYSALTASVKSNISFIEDYIRTVVTNGDELETFYLQCMAAIGRDAGHKRWLQCKELMGRVLTDNVALTDAYQTLSIADVADINSAAVAQAVWASVISVVSEWRSNYADWTGSGMPGNISAEQSNGADLRIYMRPKIYSQLVAYNALTFKDSIMDSYLKNVVICKDFGGITSSITPTYDNTTGQQLSDMSAAAFTDPHADTQILIGTYDTFLASTDKYVVKSVPILDDDIDGVQMIHRSKHTYFKPQGQPFCAFNLATA